MSAIFTINDTRVFAAFWEAVDDVLYSVVRDAGLVEVVSAHSWNRKVAFEIAGDEAIDRAIQWLWTIPGFEEGGTTAILVDGKPPSRSGYFGPPNDDDGDVCPTTFYVLHSAYPDGTWRGWEKCSGAAEC